MSEYALGVGCGIIFGLILLAVILKLTKTDGFMKCKYDERQQLVRGRGFKYAFFTLMFYNVFYGILDVALEKRVMDNFTGMIIGIVLGAMVYAIYCIWNDGYFSLNENPRRVRIAFFAIGVFNLALAFWSIAHGTVMEDGILTFRGANLFCGIMMLIICGVSFAKQQSTQKETD